MWKNLTTLAASPSILVSPIPLLHRFLVRRHHCTPFGGGGRGGGWKREQSLNQNDEGPGAYDISEDFLPAGGIKLHATSARADIVTKEAAKKPGPGMEKHKQKKKPMFWGRNLLFFCFFLKKRNLCGQVETRRSCLDHAGTAFHADKRQHSW